jgi:hypothetical protein
MTSRWHRLVTFPIFAGRELARGRALIWRFAHRLVPKRVPDISEATLDANWHVERDPAENARTAPPEDESIELPCVWMTEIYGPSRLPNLIAAVRRLGWEREEHTSPLISEGIEAWIARARLHPFGGSWLNLGPIARSGTTSILGGPRRAPLPSGISHAYGLIRVLTPALTCLTMQFFLEPGLKDGFESSLRKAMPTMVTPYRGGHAIDEPQLRKRRAIANQRVHTRRLCASWFIENAPGAFSSYGLSDAWPTIELLALQKGTPFGGAKVDGWNYLSTLGVAYDFEAWIWQPEGVLRLGPASSPEGPHGYYFSLGFNVDEASQRISLTGYENWSVALAIAYRIHHDVEPLLSTLAGGSLLSCHDQSLAKRRDDRQKSPRFPYKRASEELESLRQLLWSGADAQVAALELARYAADERRFARGAPNLSPARPEDWEGEKSYDELIRRSMATDSARVRETHDFFREVLGSRANVASALVNLRLQRLISLLTWVLVVLAAATVGLALAQLRSP